MQCGCGSYLLYCLNKILASNSLMCLQETPISYSFIQFSLEDHLHVVTALKIQNINRTASSLHPQSGRLTELSQPSRYDKYGVRSAAGMPTGTRAEPEGIRKEREGEEGRCTERGGGGQALLKLTESFRRPWCEPCCEHTPACRVCVCLRD